MNLDLGDQLATPTLPAMANTSNCTSGAIFCSWNKGAFAVAVAVAVTGGREGSMYVCIFALYTQHEDDIR